MAKEHELNQSSIEVQKQEINNFCIPKRFCPERFPSPQHPSPTDCLPPEELEKVRADIIKANELLLDLALTDNRPPDETFQKVFDGLAGLKVEITTLIGETIEGKVMTIGFNFVVLQDEQLETILPFEQIDNIKPCGRFAEPDHEQQLRDIDHCFRRDLTFHFGEVVASSPELIQIFFRISLNIYLLLLETKRIQVKVGEVSFEGLVTDVDKEIIVLKVDGESQVIPIDNILLITIKL